MVGLTNLLSILLEQAVLRLPGRVHESDNPLHLARGRVPLAKIREVIAIVIARDGLLVAAVREEFQAFRGLAAVPVGDDDVAREPFP
jgi:hypothetical protein